MNPYGTSGVHKDICAMPKLFSSTSPPNVSCGNSPKAPGHHVRGKDDVSARFSIWLTLLALVSLSTAVAWGAPKGIAA